jgi:hypothetical protein
MPPFFGALDALTVDDGGGGARLSLRPFSTLDIERVMNAIEYPVALPPDKTHVGAALAPAGPRRRDERRNNRPLLVRQVARISQVITIVSRSVLLRPHRRPPRRISHRMETQTIPTTQEVLRRTLRPSFERQAKHQIPSKKNGNRIRSCRSSHGYAYRSRVIEEADGAKPRNIIEREV